MKIMGVVAVQNNNSPD